MTVVSRKEWLEQRMALLELEKKHKREADALAAKRRALPWVKIDTDYRFTGPEGEVPLAGLFGEQSQLVVYHFMYGADWEKPCPSCSFWADHFDNAHRHLRHRDVRLVCVSIAPRPKLEAWAKKAGWSFPWYSSAGSSFNEDFHVTLDPENASRTFNFRPSKAKGEMPGVSTFIKTDEGIFHAYSAYARGLEPMNATYGILDLTPKGRDEEDLEWSMAWVKRLAEL